MNYENYPSHCSFPDSDWENFHKNHIPNWNILLSELKGKKNTGSNTITKKRDQNEILSKIFNNI